MIFSLNLKTVFWSVFSILILISGFSYAADFQKGVQAANNGDYATALREWRPLAKQGSPEAQYNLGWMYTNGKGVIQDYKEAKNWYLKSAEQGLAEAQLEVGLIYNKGQGVIKDYEEAGKWFVKSAEQGNVKAQYQLGWFYINRNVVYAHMWWNIAASNGDRLSADLRDRNTKTMTSSQLKDAQRLARECVEKKYQGCM